MAGSEHSLTIEGALDGIAEASAWAADMAAELDLPSSLTFALDVCFEEALANVITHGLKDAPPEATRVRLTIARSGAVLRLLIEDHGTPFDPLTVAEPAVPSDLEHAKIGGLGVHLMRKLARAITYERKDGANRLTLEFAVS